MMSVLIGPVPRCPAKVALNVYRQRGVATVVHCKTSICFSTWYNRAPFPWGFSKGNDDLGGII
jgi:hypothetical protein